MDKRRLKIRTRQRQISKNYVVDCDQTLVGSISHFQGLVTLTSDSVIRHTVEHHPSISTYTTNFIEIGKDFFLMSQLNFVPSSKSCETKTRTEIKNLVRTTTKIRFCSMVSESVVICQLPLKNGGGDRF